MLWHDNGPDEGVIGMKKTRNTWLTLGTVVALAAVLLTGFVAIGQTEDAAVEGYDPFAIAAAALGLTQEDLEARLDEENTLASIARDLGTDPDAIVQAIDQADGAEIDAALATGEIDEAEAAEWRDYGYVFAVEFVYLPMEEILWYAFDEEFGEFEDFADWDEDDFFDFDEEFEELGDFEGEAYGFFPYGMALETQREMAYSLLDSDVEPEAVVDAVIDSEATLLEQILGFITGLLDFDFLDDEDFGDDEIIEVVGEALGLSEDAIWDALDEGKTFAELAMEQGVEAQTLIDALMAEEEELIAELLAEGEIDEAEAEEWRAGSVEWIHEMVNEPWF